MSKPIRILIVEDLASDFELAQLEIRKSVKECVFEQVDTRKGFLQALETFQPDVILSDYSLPRFDGMTALKLAKEQAPLTPFIIWTGSLSEDIAVECMKAGANNYVLKDNIKRLGSAVVHSIEERHILVERQRANEALRESEARYHGIFESAQDAIFLESIEGDILDLNQRACEIYGYTRDEFLTKNISDLVPSKEYIIWFNNEYDAPGKPTETVNVRSNGEHFPVELSGGLYEFGEHKMFLIVLRDITERKRAEQKLRESEERFRSLIGNSLDNISLLAADGTLLWENPAVNRTLGYEQDEFVNRNIFELMHPDDQGWTSDLFGTVVSKPGSQQRGTFRLKHRDGTWRWIEATATNMLKEPSVKAVVINYREVTERKLAEIKIQQRNDDLQLINSINEAVNHGKDLGEIVDFLGKELKRIFSSTGSTLYMLDPTGKTLTMQQFIISPEISRRIEKMIGSTIPLIQIPIQEGGFFQRILNSQRGVITSDRDEIQKWMAEFIETPFLPPAARKMIYKLIPQIYDILTVRSTIVIPLILNGKTIGILDVSSAGLFTEEDLRRIENIGGQLTAAIQHQQSNEQVRRSEEFLQSVQNALSASIAILNEEGVIIQVNSAWRKFGEQNGLQDPEYCIGRNYLNICDSATGADAEEASRTARAIRDVIAGKKQEIQVEYPCHGPEEKRWFILHITKFDDGEHVWVVLAHENVTERKRAEKELREEQEKAQKYLDITGVMMLAIDQSGNVSLINQKGCEILGYSHDEIIGRNWIDSFIPESIQEQMRDVFQKLIFKDAEASQYYENPVLTRNGEERMIAWHNTLVRDENGNIITSLSSGEDITERIRAEQELRASEERFRQLAENIQEVFWITDTVTGADLYLSPAYESIWGRPPEGQYKDPQVFMKSVLLEDRPLVSQTLQVQRNGKSTEMEYRITRPDGSVRWIWDRAFPIFNDDGRMVRLAGIAADITERKEAENALRERDILLEESQKVARLGHYRLDISSGLWKSSETLNEIFGIDEDYQTDINGWVGIIHPAQRDEMINYFTVHVVEKRNAFNREYRIIRKSDGQEKWVHGMGRLEFDQKGKPVRMIGTIQDITERKQADEALRKNEQRLRIALAGTNIAVFNQDKELRYTWMYQPQSGYTSEQVVGKTDLELLPTQDALNIMEIKRHAMETGKPERAEIAIHSDNRMAYYDMTVEPMTDGNGTVIGLTGSTLDITDHKNSEMGIRRHLAEMEALYENGLAVGRLLNPREIGERIIATFAHYLSWHHVAIRLLQPESDDLELIAFNFPGLSEGERIVVEHRFQSMISKVGQGLSGWAVQTREPFRTGNVHAHPQYVDTHPGIKSGLYMPLKIGDRILGVISVESEEPDAFTAQDERLLATLANQASVAFENARLYHTNQQERERFSELFENTPVATWLEDFSEVIFWMDGLRAQGITNLKEYLEQNPQQYKLGVSLIDILDVNQAAVMMNGARDKEELLEKVHGLMMEETPSPVMINEFESIWKGYTSFGFEMSSRRLDGSMITGIQRIYIPANNNEPDYARVIVTNTDITDRIGFEQRLRASEIHYRELADSITDIFFELDRDLRYSHWNKASEILTGFSAENAIGKSMSDIFGSSKEQDRIEQIYRDVLKNHQPRIVETKFLVNKQPRNFEITAYPSTRGVAVVAKDVTERKLSESLMQKRFELMEYSNEHNLEELMQKALDEISEWTHSAIGFFQFIKEDQITPSLQVWSTDTFQNFHSSQAEVMHKPADQAGVWAEAIRQRRAVIHNDYESMSGKKGLPEGHAPLIRELVVPIIRNEKVVAVIGIGNKLQDYTRDDLEITERFADYAWDIIERKQMVMEIAEERNQLAKRVEERTSDLSRANSNLARALRVKDEFLANMSHELRTPLNAILGLSESLGEQTAGPLNEKQQRYLTTISESGHHLLALINDILDLAKIEAGQITLDINKVDVNSVSQASLRMIKQLAQKKNLNVSVDIDEKVGLMWVDERRLKQMMVNLLSNAVKFTPEGGNIGLQIEGSQDENKVMITVWDTGIGIKEIDFERLFRPFVQLDSGLARESSGTGLGLALVAQMARLHGGSVTVQSEAGQGSRFTITLPWEPALTPDTVERLKVTGKFLTIRPGQTQPTILLIEDTQEVVMMIRDYLEMAGYKVVTAQDGLDGIAQAKFAHPDLILMDIQMPRMDGLEATQKLRQDPEFKYTPIIALTALAMPNDRERCLAAGMDEYISKPVNLRGLVKLIQSNLSLREEKTQSR